MEQAIQPEDAAHMLNIGWPIAQIAQLHNATGEQVIVAIREHVRQERLELKRLK